MEWFHGRNCYQLSKIEEGTKVPVGQMNAGGPNPICSSADFSNFGPFFDAVTKKHESYRIENIAAWLARQGIGVPPELFALMAAFNATVSEYYSLSADRAKERDLLLDERRCVPLSELFERGLAQCTEIAALALVWLHRRGAPANYFAGFCTERRLDADADSLDDVLGHAWITTEKYIYDVARPHVAEGGGIVPRLIHKPAQFEERLRQSKKNCLIQAFSAMTGDQVVEGYFGIFPDPCLEDHNFID